jgi:hypothetical protein
MSVNSLILAMVAARRNYAGRNCADQIKKAGLPASIIVAQSVRRHRALRPAVKARETDPMTIAAGLATLFSRDLTRLIQELRAFPNDETLWESAPGVKNSAGNLVLHLEGNLREYIGRQLGQVAYTRVRDQEFAPAGISRDDLVRRMEQVKGLVVKVVSGLSDNELAAPYPESVLETTLCSRDFLVHLHGHLNFHLGQIDYLRRILTEGSAVAFAGL